jgi:hypothetical protein
MTAVHKTAVVINRRKKTFAFDDDEAGAAASDIPKNYQEEWRLPILICGTG